jgi:hypothetical protein
MQLLKAGSQMIRRKKFWQLKNRKSEEIENEKCIMYNYIRDAVIIGFIANELISIVENAGLMGLPLPSVLTKAIDVLKNKAVTE